MALPRSVLVYALASAALLGGCEKLEARQKANDAAGQYKKGMLRKAAAEYEEAAKLDPAIPEVQLNLGFAYLSLHAEEPGTSPQKAEFATSALNAFKRYIQLRPEDPRGRNYLVQTFVDAKRYDEAKEYFKKEIEKEPPSLEIITIMSEIAAKLGKLDDALALCEKRATLKPDDPDAHLALGILIWDHLHRHPDIIDVPRIELSDRGINALKRAIELKPNSVDSLTYINLLYRERMRGHPCEIFDGGLPDAEPPTKKKKKPAKDEVPDTGVPDIGTADECENAQAEDLKLANQFFTQARELMKLQADAGTADAAKGK